MPSDLVNKQDEMLRQFDAALFDVVNALDKLKHTTPINRHIEQTIEEFFQDAWDHVRLLMALRQEADRVEWHDPAR